MTASWSSAATGKPQLSYAERLRRAKEDSTKSANAGSAESASVADKQESALRDHSTQQEEVVEAGPKSIQPAQSSSSTKSDTNVVNGAAIASGSATPASTSTGKDETPVANVWEARRKKLNQGIEAGGGKSQVSGSVPPTTAGGDSAGHVDHSPSSRSKSVLEGTAAAITAGNSWVKKPNLVNGDSGTKAGISTANTPPVSRHGMAGEVVSETKESLAKAPNSTKRGTKKQERGTEGMALLPPSLVDEQVWPSPENALIAKTGSEEGKERTSRVVASSTPSPAGLQGLDVEIINHPGGEKQRHGKQWISIVPHITHSTPLPSSSSGGVSGGKKKGGKGNVAKQADSTVASPASTSSTPLSVRRSDQSRSRGSIQRESRGERPTHGAKTSATTSPLVLSPQPPSASSLVGSPTVDSRLLSPRLSTSRPGGEQRESSRSSFSGTRISRKSSPSPMHAVFSSQGTVRGPRFAEEGSFLPADRSARRSPMTASTPTEQATEIDRIENVISGVNNALHLSTPNTSSSQMIPPNSDSESPLPSSDAQPSTSMVAENTAMQRIRSGAPSPRGHRGRGSSRRKSSEEGESSSSGKTDADLRGLPKDVPSGPRQRNGEHPSSLKSPLMYRNRGPPYAMYSPPLPPHPMMAHGMPPGMYMSHGSAPVPYNQYYQHPIPGLAQIPGVALLEKTPDEFAPRTLDSSQEPSKSLLHQLEFYFTHRNLEGDFYLRKSMDAQGFVPIHFIASFKKVQKMTGNVEVVRDTLLYSKVLELSVDRSAVRKAIDWHLYTLLDGERPQPHLYQQHRPLPGQTMIYPPPFGLPTMTNRPPPPMHFAQSPPPPPFVYPPMHMHGSGGGAGAGQYRQIPAQTASAPAVSPYPHQDLRVPPQTQSKQSNGFHTNQASTTKTEDNDDDETSGDNDDDEVLGVVAAEGLGGALRM